MPCLLLAFLVWRVADQSFSSALPLTTKRGKVSVYVSTRKMVYTWDWMAYSVLESLKRPVVA